MHIDCHAHYVPPELVETLERRAADFGLSTVRAAPDATCAVHFDYGVKLRPFFPKLVEPLERRFAGMDAMGIDRQVLSVWADMFGYGLPRATAISWHRFLNERLGALTARESGRFSMLATVPLPDADAAASELAYAVEHLGAVGAVIAANVEGANLGDLALDPFWHAACELDVPVFLHPTQPMPSARTAKHALGQIAQYTFDTTLTVGSLIFAGVLDRFPALRILLSHGGGAFPYLLGRFDIMHARMDRASQGDLAAQAPSEYVRRFWYDTILHDARTLHWLAESVGDDRLVLGSDYSFPPEDRDPLASVGAAGFAPGIIERIAEHNARVLFPRLP